jgi:hypothetical protein
LACREDVLTPDDAKIAAVTGFMVADLFPELQSAAPARDRGADDPVKEPARRAWITGSELFSRLSLPAELP